MDIEDAILVATVREEIRGGAFRVDTADIPRHVEMTQANRLVSKVYSDKLEIRSIEQESGSTMDPVSKSVNTSTTNLLGDSPNADSASGHAPAESGESQLPPMSEALQAEKLEGIPSEEVHSSEHLTLTTEVPVAHVAIAGSTTSGDSRDEGRNEGEGRESGEKVLEDDQTIPTIMTKDSTSVGAPDAPASEDDWWDPLVIPVKTKTVRQRRRPAQVSSFAPVVVVDARQ